MADAPAAAPAAPAPTNGQPPPQAARPPTGTQDPKAAPSDAKPPAPPWEKLGLVHRREGDKDIFEREVDDGRGGKRKLAIDASDPDSFFRDHEYGTAGRKAQSEADKAKKRAEEIQKQFDDDIAALGDALRNPKTRVGTLIALAKKAGVESDVMGEIIAEHERQKGMTPEQRELEARRRADEDRQRSDEERAKREAEEKVAREKAAQAEAEVQLAEGLWNQTTKALEKASLPDERIFRNHVTSWAAAALERFGDKQPIDFGEAAKSAHADYVRVMPGVLERLPDDQLLSTLGDKALARIVTLYAARQRSGPPTLQTGDRASTATHDRPDGGGSAPQRRVPVKPFVP